MSFRRMAAIVVTSLLGSTIGLLVGFFNSGLVGVSLGFWYWISYPLDSWHWPILGLLVGGLSSLALHLWYPDSWPDQKGPLLEIKRDHQPSGGMERGQYRKTGDE
jgi:hypothetical protein